ncbi:N-acetylglucosamine-6-phosphate deacetylase [Candidatus Bathyarchaeota archaeon]|nr:MAG: N-acetylglucosamine-6-phosphate deacetylase [Candidatus Bathyarchaeota archaeon]
MSLAIRVGKVYTPDAVIENGVVVLRDGRISYVGRKMEKADGVKLLDFPDCICTPGFIDLHVHGGGGYDFADGEPRAFRTICRYHATGGTTSLLATIWTSPIEHTFKVLEVSRRCVGEASRGAELLGVHLEGPFLSPEKHGAHSADYLKTPSRELVEAFLEYVDVVKRITIAPELEGGVEAVRAFSSSGVMVSIGHSTAPYSVVEEAYNAGLSHATHLYNALGTAFKRGVYRIPGALESVLALDGITAELIADGVHVHPALIEVAVKVKGYEKLCLVTDAMRAAGMPDGVYKLGSPLYAPDAVVKNGISYTRDMRALASTTIRMIDAVRFMTRLGYPLRRVLSMASSVPARLIGVSCRKGYLRPGFDGDLVVLDERLDVLLTVVKGQVVYRKPGS